MHREHDGKAVQRNYRYAGNHGVQSPFAKRKTAFDSSGHKRRNVHDARNIGGLLNIKNVYLVPFGQDDCYRKPTSLIANHDLLIPAIEKALDGECLQPQLI